VAVRYVRVHPVAVLFSPVIRPTGNIAIIGAAALGTDNLPVPVASPTEAADAFGPATVPDPQPGNPGQTKPNSALTASFQLLFQQTPGPSQIWGVKATGQPTAAVADPSAALAAAENLDVQFVLLAGTPLDNASGAPDGAIGKLAAHVVAVSDTGGEGKERMGVAMLAKGVADPTVVTSKAALVSDRMIYVAHKSDQDAGAAVAGTVAGYQPHISMLLKQVSIDSEPFTSAEIDAINGSETFDSGPAGNGINWLVDPSLIPGGGIYLGEGYTGNPGGKKYIDVQREIDDMSFKLKARLIRSVGEVRIGRSDLRSLVVQMEAVLDPLIAGAVIEGYTIVIPVLNLLDADPASLTAVQLQTIRDAQRDRVVEVLVAVDYAGAIHRIAITLKFE
jgi:hypothetical protein